MCEKLCVANCSASCLDDPNNDTLHRPALRSRPQQAQGAAQAHSQYPSELSRAPLCLSAARSSSVPLFGWACAACDMVVKCDNEGVQMKTHDILDKDERTVAKAGGMPINLKVYANSQGGMTKEASRFWLDESVFSHCPSGRSREASGNGRPRRMAIHRPSGRGQNPAYRPSDAFIDKYSR